MKMKTAPRLGPGALEGITLQLAKRRYSSGGFHMAARVTGTYTVYCGMGWDHRVDVAETADLDRSSDLWDDLLAAYDDDVDAAYRVAGQLVDWSLEDWFDPCDDGDDVD